MRIALIHVAQETNDFNPQLTSLQAFRDSFMELGPDILAKAKGYGQTGGYMQAVEESGLDIETVPIIRAFSGAGGRISKEAFDFFSETMRTGLKNAGKLDGVALILHGACAAEGVDDADAEFTRICREATDPAVPIVLMLDHHADITGKMVANCTAIVGHRTQPHDLLDTGIVGTKLLLRIIQEKLKPVMAWRKIPLVTHQEQFLTSQAPMKTWFDRARAMEAADPRVLQASNYPMQPWLDVSEGGWATIVVTDNDQDLAEKLADELADLCWSLRDDFLVRTALPVDEAILKADAAAKGVVVLSDTGDTVFGGAAGDSNIILEAMLRLKIKGPALIPMISPNDAIRLSEAGEGATVTLPLGGHVATEFFKPLEVTGTVRKVGGGMLKVNYHQAPEVNLGRAVLFDVGPVTLLITELRGGAGNFPGLYSGMGVDPTDYKMAVLKTASNFQFFKEITSEVIRVDTKGPGQSDVYTLPWKRLPRPIYPLEKIADWRDGPLSGQG